MIVNLLFYFVYNFYKIHWYRICRALHQVCRFRTTWDISIANCSKCVSFMLCLTFQQKQNHMRVWFSWNKIPKAHKLIFNWNLWNLLWIPWNRMAYEEKKKMLFDCLLTAEKSIVGTSLEQKESFRGHLPQRNESRVVGRRFQGRESIFKRPAAPISKCLKPRRAPDYQVCVYFWKIDLFPARKPSDQNPFVYRWIHTNGKSIRCQMQIYRTVRTHRLHLHSSRKSRSAKTRSTAPMTTRWMEKLLSNERV